MDKIGLKIELPYPKESPGDLIITNYSNHNPIAYKVRWESIKFNGEVVERQAIKYHLLALLEKDPSSRASLLAKNPMLPPQTRWLTGLGRETQQLTGRIPSLKEIGRNSDVFPDLAEYKLINVTLENVMLENDQVLGRNPESFSQEIQTLVERQVGGKDTSVSSKK
ncbi:MAG: hypothetical protein WCB68_14455 [Pyrinomonadaceae bacterium]